MISFLLSSIFIFGIDPGGGDDHCPDQVVFEKPTHVTYGTDLGCGGSRFEGGGLQVNNPSRYCPAFAVIVPAHAATRKSKKSGTFTRPLATIKITRIDFACKPRYFLFFRIGSQCTVTGSSVVSAVASYKQLACSDRETEG